MEYTKINQFNSIQKQLTHIQTELEDLRIWQQILEPWLLRTFNMNMTKLLARAKRHRYGPLQRRIFRRNKKLNPSTSMSSSEKSETILPEVGYTADSRESQIGNISQVVTLVTPNNDDQNFTSLENVEVMESNPNDTTMTGSQNETDSDIPITSDIKLEIDEMGFNTIEQPGISTNSFYRDTPEDHDSLDAHMSYQSHNNFGSSHTNTSRGRRGSLTQRPNYTEDMMDMEMEIPYPGIPPLLLNGKYFAIVSYNRVGRISAQCQRCGPQKIINGAGTSNFLTHLKRLHMEDFKSYEQEKLLAEKVKMIQKIKRQK